MKKTIFLALFIALFSACKKDNTNSCASPQKDVDSFEYIEKDTTSSFFNKKTFSIVEALVCRCSSGCASELRIRNLVDKKVEIKVFRDSAFTNLFATEVLSVTNWSKQTSFGEKSSIKEFTKFMKVSYK